MGSSRRREVEQKKENSPRTISERHLCLFLGLKSRGLLAQALVWAKLGRCSVSKGGARTPSEHC